MISLGSNQNTKNQVSERFLDSSLAYLVHRSLPLFPIPYSFKCGSFRRIGGLVGWVFCGSGGGRIGDTY